jgi:probable F420-dependent oxidoreductase
MKIGINISISEESPDVAETAEQLEQLGFESFWLPEHVLVPVTTTSRYAGSADGSIPERMAHMIDPFIGLAMASARTQNLKLGTAVCLIPERNPLLLSKEIATLDQLSGGRFILGVGAGWLREESEILGGDFPHRWTQAKEAVLAMKELWTKDEAEFHGKYYDFPAVRSFPKPAQKPHPPVYLGGQADNIFKRVVAWADGWMPTGRVSPEEVKEGRRTLDDLASEMGRDPKSIEITAFGLAADSVVLERYEEAGADRVIIRAAAFDGDENLLSINEIADRVLS